MKSLRFMALVLGLMISGSVFAKDCTDDSQFKEISYEELKTKINKKEVFVIDVNSKKSFKDSHIPSAIHFESSRKQLANLLPKKKDTLVVAYCGGPKCTAWKRAAEEACKMGYTQVKHFKGGISGWKKRS